MTTKRTSDLRRLVTGDVLVQSQDEDGFWTNVAQFVTADLPHAKKYADFWANQSRQTARVVLGPERKIVGTYAWKGADHETRLTE